MSVKFTLFYWTQWDIISFWNTFVQINWNKYRITTYISHMNEKYDPPRRCKKIKDASSKTILPTKCLQRRFLFNASLFYNILIGRYPPEGNRNYTKLQLTGKSLKPPNRRQKEHEKLGIWKKKVSTVETKTHYTFAPPPLPPPLNCPYILHFCIIFRRNEK